LLSAAEYQPAPRHQQRVFSALTWVYVKQETRGARIDAKLHLTWGAPLFRPDPACRSSSCDDEAMIHVLICVVWVRCWGTLNKHIKELCLPPPPPPTTCINRSV
jgi:hypothetical protein